MNVERIRELLLERAIQGKLAPQLDSEPTVEQLGKAPDEVPFEIPEKWKWEFLGDLAVSVDYGTSEKCHAEYEKGDIPILRMANIQPRGVSFENLKYCKKQIIKSDLYLSEGDLLFNRTNSAELVGKCNVFHGERDSYSFASYIIRIKLRNCSSEWVSAYINSERCRHSQIIPNVTQQVGQANFSGSKLKKVLVPVPPLAEQRRIVARLNELLPLVDSYEKNEADLQRLAELLKRAVLQKAIEGKLVPQLDSEPAVEQIGKAPEDVPFDIPEKWKWVFLPKLSSITYGYPFESDMFNTEGRGKSLIRIRDILDGVSKTYTTELAPDAYNINNGDMLVGMDGNFNVNYWKGGPAWLNQRVCKIEAKDECADQYYLFYFLPFALKQEQDSVSYTTVKHLSAKALSAMPVPLPPLGEQRRIVARIKELFDLIDNHQRTAIQS